MGWFDFLGNAEKAIGGAVKGVQDTISNASRGHGVFSFLNDEEEKKREEERRRKLEEDSKKGNYDQYGNFVQSEGPGVFNAIGESLNELGNAPGNMIKSLINAPAEQAKKAFPGVADTIEGAPKGVNDIIDAGTEFTKSYVGGTVQGALKAPLQLANSKTGNTTETSQDDLGRLLYGDQNTQTSGQEGRDILGLVTEPFGLKKEDINPNVAAAVGVPLVIMNALPLAGGGKKEGAEGALKAVPAVLEALSKADTAANVTKTIKGVKGLESLSDDVVKRIAPEIAKLQNKDAIMNVLGTAVRQGEAGIDASKRAVGGASLGRINPQGEQQLGQMIDQTMGVEDQLNNLEKIQMYQPSPKQLSEMGIDELRDVAAKNSVTGLPSGRVMRENIDAGKHSNIASLDVTGLTHFNKYGEDAGNTLLNAVGRTMEEVQKNYDNIDIYHPHGDEFFAGASDPKVAEAFSREVNDKLANKVFTIEDKNGTLHTVQGAQLNYGIGQDVKSADAAMQGVEHGLPGSEANQYYSKAARKARGEAPAAKGELPGGTTITPLRDTSVRGSVGETAPRGGQQLQDSGRAGRTAEPSAVEQALPQTEQALLPAKEAPLQVTGDTKTFSPGQAKQELKKKPENRLFEGEIPVKKTLPERTKSIRLFEDIKDTRNVATKETKAGNTVPIAPHGGELIVPDVGDVENIKNVGGSLKDPIMRIEQATKEGSKEREVAQDFLLKAHDENKTRYVADQEKYNGVVKTITEKLGINNKKLSAAAQDLGEGTLKREDAVAKFGERTVQNMEKANDLARKLYDETLANVNKTREAWGKEPIKRRNDYYRHFQEIGNSFKQLTGPTEDAMGISKGKASIFNSAAKERKGGAYKSDLVGGINDYLNATLRETHFTDSMKRYEAYADAVEAKSQAQGVKLTGFINRLREQAKAIGSQPVGFDVPLSTSETGKKALNVMSWVQQRVGKNTIIGNASSALAQTLGWAAAPAEVGTKNTFLGALDNMAAALSKGGDDVLKKSTFLKERYFDQAGIKSAGQRLEGVAAKPFEIIEEATSNAIWRSSYRKALQDGLKGEEAVRQADTYAKKIIGARGIGDKALAFESKTGNAALQFQLEVNNLYQRYMKEAAGIGGHAKMNPKKMATFAVTTYLMNSAFEQITGRRPLPDFINAGIEAGQDVSKGNYKAAAGRIPGEVLGNMPGGQTLASFLPDDIKKEYLGQTDVGRYSGTIPIAQVAQDVAGLASNPAKSSSKLLAEIGAPFAGKPSQRFLKAGVDAQKGYKETDKGEVKYQTGGLGDFIKEALFGENATANGKQYYKDQLKPLSDKQSAYVKNVVEQQRDNPDKEEASKIVSATFKFYQTRQKAAQKVKYQEYSDNITEALGQGDKQKAQQLANEYNTKVYDSFSDYGDEYGSYMSKDLQEDFAKLFINLNKASVSRRIKSYNQSN